MTDIQIVKEALRRRSLVPLEERCLIDRPEAARGRISAILCWELGVLAQDKPGQVIFSALGFALFFSNFAYEVIQHIL